MTLQINITSDFKKAIKMLDEKNAKRAMSRAINRTLPAARKSATPTLYNKFESSLTKAKLRQLMRITRANPRKLAGSISVSGGPIPLINFGAREIQSGVSFKSGSSRKVIEGAFIAKMPGSNKKQVWKRTGRAKVFAKQGRYKGKTFKREPIKRLFGPSLPMEFMTDDVQKAIAGEIRKTWPAFFKRELDYYMARFR